MSTETVTISTADGDFTAYLAHPASEPTAAIVVIQEIFGVNAFVREVCERLAAQGYLAIAPDLFWRIEPGIDLTDHTDADWKRAFELYNAFDVDAGVRDIGATIAWVRPKSSGKANLKVGAIGFCLGGLLAYLTATRSDADASVAYYGVGIDRFTAEADKLANPLLLHIAEEDQFVPKEAQAQILTALKNHAHVEIHTYPGRDHAFSRTGGDHYNAEDAATAAERTFAFFKTALA